jgi:carboxylate-amine ligase
LRPLWLRDLTFDRLNRLLERIDFEPALQGLTLDGLELDPPHKKLMPYYVEGYGVADHDLTTYVDILPKGVEIRTPVCPDLDTCLRVYERLYEELQRSLADDNLRAVGFGHHPVAWEFTGPQNHKRHDWWLWALQVATTYGPDLNLSPADPGRFTFSWDQLQRRANYYGPALAAFGLNSPVRQGSLWNYRGRPGLSVRTHRRSPFAPMLAWHPKEGGRVEFKSFDMPTDHRDFRPFFLLWLWLLGDAEAPGRAEDQERIYDLGEIARHGWAAEDVVVRAEEALDRATAFLPRIGIDPASLSGLHERLTMRATPAQEVRSWVNNSLDVPALMGRLLEVATTASLAA